MRTSSEQDKLIRVSDEVSVGPYLKKLREAQGHSLEQVSMRIKYSPQQIEALESEHWNNLPSGAPMRWLVRSYARFLGVDQDAIQAMLETALPDTAKAHAESEHKMRWEAQDMSLYVAPRQRTWGWWLVALVLFVVILFYAVDQGWIPESWLIFDWLKALNQ